MNLYGLNWRRIAFFMLIATSLSNLARFKLLEVPAGLGASWHILLSVLAEGAGILLAALLARHFLHRRQPVTVTLLGSAPHFSLLMALIALALVSLVGVANPDGLEPRLYGLLAASGTLAYCIMEEYGWRGYLQTELAPLANGLKYGLVGGCWYIWHLTFLTDASLFENLFFLAMMIFGSWGIGQVADATKSVLACACFHLIIQIMMFNALIRNGISLQEKLLILLIALSAYLWLVKRWQRQYPVVPARA